jgi:hypothetical protein
LGAEAVSHLASRTGSLAGRVVEYMLADHVDAVAPTGLRQNGVDARG